MTNNLNAWLRLPRPVLYQDRLHHLTPVVPWLKPYNLLFYDDPKTMLAALLGLCGGSSNTFCYTASFLTH